VVPASSERCPVPAGKMCPEVTDLWRAERPTQGFPKTAGFYLRNDEGRFTRRRFALSDGSVALVETKRDITSRPERVASLKTLGLHPP